MGAEKTQNYFVVWWTGQYFYDLKKNPQKLKTPLLLRDYSNPRRRMNQKGISPEYTLTASKRRNIRRSGESWGGQDVEVRYSIYAVCCVL